jgi:malonyl CoA-acyl carrier protein transacylase
MSGGRAQTGADQGVLALFPGQGSQKVGMGREQAEASKAAAEVFDLGSDILGIDARKLCWHTPMEVLTRTENAQPAITIAALADWAAAGEMGQRQAVFAGHSIGAIAAAAAAGHISTAAAIKLAAARGALMAAAPGAGSMLAVAVSACGSAAEQEQRARELAGRFDLDVGAVNGPTQIVLSGPAENIESAKGAMRGKSKELAVSHAFHSRMMLAAEPEWHLTISAVEMATAPASFYQGCINGIGTTDPAIVRADLEASLTKPVLWSRVMESTLSLGEIRAFGPAKAIARLARPYLAGRRLTMVGAGR